MIFSPCSEVRDHIPANIQAFPGICYGLRSCTLCLHNMYSIYILNTDGIR